MIKFNDTFIIGIDHGYGNLKTANTVTPSGVKIHESEPPFKKDVLEYDGKYICIGENHKFFVDDNVIIDLHKTKNLSSQEMCADFQA